jgi:putative heme-binding domain-containing protein
MRRFAAAGTRRDLLTCARLLQLSPDAEHSRILMHGFEEAFKGRSVAGLPDELITAMARHQVGSDAFKLRTGDDDALTRALAVITDAKAGKQRRQEFIDVLGEVRPPAALDALLRVADDERDPTLRKSALTALLGYDDARVPATVLKDYSAYASEVRPAALTLLASRAAWSLALAEAVDAGKLKPIDVPLDTVRQLQRQKSAKLAPLLTKHWPNAGRPTSEAMQQQIARLDQTLRDGKRGDPYAGQKLFNASCASCHTLFARGGHVGPDLTAYQRSDLNALLLAVVNPSAEVREGYESFNVETKDDRSFTGFLVEQDARFVVLRGLDGQNISLKQEDMAEMKPAGLSLMPEGLLDPLTDQQVRDLFAYLRSTQPLAN